MHGSEHDLLAKCGHNFSDKTSKNSQEAAGFPQSQKHPPFFLKPKVQTSFASANQAGFCKYLTDDLGEKSSSVRTGDLFLLRKPTTHSNWTLSVWPLFLLNHNKQWSLWLWLHVNYRHLFQSRRGRGGGSVSMNTTQMNRTWLKASLSTSSSRFPRKWERGSGVRWLGDGGIRKHGWTYRPSILYLSLNHGFNRSPIDRILSLCQRAVWMISARRFSGAAEV